MKLAVGQVYEHRTTGERVRVGEHRPLGHPKAMEVECAIAYPAWCPSPEEAHPFDAVILAPELPHHGDSVWRLV